MHPLLGHVRRVHQQDPLARARLGPHRLPVPFQERLVGPGAVRCKVLQAAHLVHVALQLAQDHALDRLAPLPRQQPLGVGGEGGRLVAAREQGPKTVQVGLQGRLELEQVVAGQRRGRGRDGGHGGSPWAESGSFNLPHDFSLQ